jgi:hypothetical protein
MYNPMTPEQQLELKDFCENLHNTSTPENFHHDIDKFFSNMGFGPDVLFYIHEFLPTPYKKLYFYKTIKEQL